jgi:hypothetical protein
MTSIILQITYNSLELNLIYLKFLHIFIYLLAFDKLNE